MTNVVTISELETLSDYTVHLTGYDTTNSSATPSSNPPPSNTTGESYSNPSTWPTDHRRVPDYRPIDRTRDPADRPNGNNGFERAFLRIMFGGLFMNATAAKIWGATGGPYFPDLFKYAIGGEW